uniref:EGF-like domain-containing protein n=1 Tax=Panagrellus redivivus TaxID=6233 RepID=A0A7E4USF7_PANRE
MSRFAFGFLFVAVYCICSISSEKCPERECENGGQCWGRFDTSHKNYVKHCFCAPPFTGEFCESKIPTSCDQLKCGNGTCQMVYSEYAGRDYAQCACNPGYDGDNCEIVEDVLSRKSSNSADEYTYFYNYTETNHVRYVYQFEVDYGFVWTFLSVSLCVVVLTSVMVYFLKCCKPKQTKKVKKSYLPRYIAPLINIKKMDTIWE